MFFKMPVLLGQAEEKKTHTHTIENPKGRRERNLDGFHVAISAKDKSTSGWIPSGGLI